MLYNFAIRLMRGINFIFYGFRKPDNSLVPKDGGLIICSNHPGLHDPIFVATALDRQLTFMAKKELFAFKPFGKLLTSLGAFPIDRYKSDISALKNSVKLLKSGHAMLIFPQGTRSKKSDNNDGKHGAIRLAMMTGVPIVPVGISDNYRVFKKLNVRVGKPIDYTKYKSEHLTDDDYDRLTKELMDEIYALSEGKENDN